MSKSNGNLQPKTKVVVMNCYTQFCGLGPFSSWTELSIETRRALNGIANRIRERNDAADAILTSRAPDNRIYT